MARKLSDRAQDIAGFFRILAMHLETKSGVFMGDPELPPVDAEKVRRELEKLTDKYQSLADKYRADGR